MAGLVTWHDAKLVKFEGRDEFNGLQRAAMSTWSCASRAPRLVAHYELRPTVLFDFPNDSHFKVVFLQTGQSIQRAPRRRGAIGNVLPRQPAAGWPLLVTPLHAGRQRGDPYVAMPDGHRRALTADEALYLKHFKHEVRTLLMSIQSC